MRQLVVERDALPLEINEINSMIHQSQRAGRASGRARPERPARGPADRDVLMAMSVLELKAVMVAQGLSPHGLLEKVEFVDAIVAWDRVYSPSRG